MSLKSIRFALFLLCLAPCALAQRGFISVGGGVGPAGGNVRTDPNWHGALPQVRGTLLLDGGYELFRARGTSIALDFPVAFYGSRRSDVEAIRTYTGIYTERIAVAVTPGLRVGLFPEHRVSPWVSFGAGLAVIHRTGTDFDFNQQTASQIDSNLTVALAPGAGIDVRVTRRWFVRWELRDYLYRTPANGFVSAFPYWNRWNQNVVVAGSLGFRFP